MVDPQKLTIDLSKRWEERAAPLLPKQHLPAFCQSSAESTVLVSNPIHDAITVRQTWRALLSFGRKLENPQAVSIAKPGYATAIKIPQIELPDSAMRPAEPITDAVGIAMISDMPAITLMATGKADRDGSAVLSVAHASEGCDAAANQLQPVTGADEGAMVSGPQADRGGLQLVTEEGRAISLSARWPSSWSHMHMCSLPGAGADASECPGRPQ